MGRTVTKDWQEFTRPNVTYRFNDGAKAHITTITILPESDWTSELHWHENHHEFLRIVQGAALVTVGSLTRTYSANDGMITIERGVLHEWKRDPDSHETLIVEEWTDPADGQKELFFRNLCSSILDLTAQPAKVTPSFGMSLDWLITIQVFVIFRAYDNYPVLYHGPFMKTSTYLVLFAAVWTGWLLGVKAEYSEYVKDKHYKEE